MNRNVIFAPDELYHVYNRGVEKRDIYLDRREYERFLSLLFLANSAKPIHIQKTDQSSQGWTLTAALEVERDETLVDIVAYCLMPNHFHILVKEKDEGAISKFMQKLSTGYTMYFNKRHDRNGALFQGKFKATHADEDRYLKYLYSYIHLNPIKLIQSDWKEIGIKNFNQAENYLNQYKYSSYLDYLGERRPENKIINMNAGPEYFASAKELEEEMRDWLDLKIEQ